MWRWYLEEVPRKLSMLQGPLGLFFGWLSLKRRDCGIWVEEDNYAKIYGHQNGQGSSWSQSPDVSFWHWVAVEQPQVRIECQKARQRVTAFVPWAWGRLRTYLLYKTYQSLDHWLLRDHGTHSFQLSHPRLDIYHFDPRNLWSRPLAKRRRYYLIEDPSIKPRKFPVCWPLSG